MSTAEITRPMGRVTSMSRAWMGKMARGATRPMAHVIAPSAQRTYATASQPSFQRATAPRAPKPKSAMIAKLLSCLALGYQVGSIISRPRFLRSPADHDEEPALAGAGRDHLGLRHGALEARARIRGRKELLPGAERLVDAELRDGVDELEA